MKTRQGFTLIELLVVIAIIALLSAIIFPVFSRAKAQAARNADISDLNTLNSALQLYRVDQGAYPPQLLGYVTLYTSGPNMGNVVPANEVRTALYPRRVQTVDTFQPNWNRFMATDTTTAVYPNQDPRPVGSNPILDVNGDGIIDNNDDPNGARQAYGPTNGNVCEGGGTMAMACISGVEAQFYQISGYDVAPVRTSTGGTRNELRYTLFWTSFGLANGAANDDPRQLGYNDPPDTTVVTWNSGWRDYDGNEPVNAKLDHVLFLNGSARPYASQLLHERSWRVMP